MVFIAVYKDKCTGCGSCVSTCQNQVLAIDDGLCQVVRKENCRYCMDCVASCDFDAIKVFV